MKGLCCCKLDDRCRIIFKYLGLLLLAILAGQAILPLAGHTPQGKYIAELLGSELEPVCLSSTLATILIFALLVANARRGSSLGGGSTPGVNNCAWVRWRRSLLPLC